MRLGQPWAELRTDARTGRQSKRQNLQRRPSTDNELENNEESNIEIRYQSNSAIRRRNRRGVDAGVASHNDPVPTRHPRVRSPKRGVNIQ